MSPGSTRISLILAVLRWAAWILVITASALVTWYLFQVSGMALDAYVVIVPPIAAVLSSALIGLLQWILVFKRVPGTGGWFWATALASFAAWIAALFLFLVNMQDPFPADLRIIHLLLFGILVGLAQWWFLRSRLPGAWWWLIASLLGWVCAGISLTLMMKNSGLEEYAQVIVSGAVAGSFLGTGAVLVFDRSSWRATSLRVVGALTVLLLLGGAVFVQTVYSQQSRTLLGHTKWVEAVAFSPDGNRIASAGAEGALILWDVSSGRELYMLSEGPLAPPDSIWSDKDYTGLAFSPDGSLLAGVCSDNMLRLWEAATGRELFELDNGSSLAPSVAFSPDGSLLVTGSPNEAKVKLWDTATGRVFRTLKSSIFSISSVAFSPTGDHVAASGDIIEVWELYTGQLQQGRLLLKLKGFSGHARQVAFSPDGKYIAVAAGETYKVTDHTLMIWEVASGRMVLDEPGIGIYSLAWSPDGTILALACGEEGLVLWDVGAGHQLTVLRGGGIQNNLAFSPDGKLLVSGSYDNAVRLWKVPAIP